MPRVNQFLLNGAETHPKPSPAQWHTNAYTAYECPMSGNIKILGLLMTVTVNITNVSSLLLSVPCYRFSLTFCLVHIYLAEAVLLMYGEIEIWVELPLSNVQ